MCTQGLQYIINYRYHYYVEISDLVNQLKVITYVTETLLDAQFVDTWSTIGAVAMVKYNITYSLMIYPTSLTD